MESAITRPLEQNLDIKREKRRWRGYIMYLDGMSQEAIADVLDVSRSTIVDDLTEVRRRIAARPPMDMEAIRQETYQRMIELRTETILAARASVAVNGKAKLYEVAAKLDLKILERYTQQGKDMSASKDDSLGMAVVDYITERFGPEEMDNFIEWHEQKTSAAGRLKSAVKAS